MVTVWILASIGTQARPRWNRPRNSSATSMKGASPPQSRSRLLFQIMAHRLVSLLFAKRDAKAAAVLGGECVVDMRADCLSGLLKSGHKGTARNPANNGLDKPPK